MNQQFIGAARMPAKTRGVVQPPKPPRVEEIARFVAETAPAAPIRRAEAPPPTPEAVLVARRKKRLQDVIAREGYGSAASVARQAGRTQANINHLSLPGYPFGDRAARQLEKDLNLPHLYFDLPGNGGGEARAVHNVPIVSWANCGRDYEGIEAEVVAVPWDVGPQAIACISQAGMWSPDSSTGVPPGWLAIIDPAVSPRAGDIVAAWLDGAREATLRQVVDDAGRLYLFPVDPRIPSSQEWRRRDTVVGTVIGCLKLFRQ